MGGRGRENEGSKIRSKRQKETEGVGEEKASSSRWRNEGEIQAASLQLRHLVVLLEHVVRCLCNLGGATRDKLVDFLFVGVEVEAVALCDLSKG